MPVYDFSSGLNLLNQGINSLGEALSNRTDTQNYVGIGQSIAQGDYQGAAARAWAAGKPDLALKLQSMGLGYAQTQSLLGQGQQPSAGAPAPSDGAQPTKLTPTQATTGAPTGGGFMDSVARIESGNQNIFSGVDKDYPGQPGSRSQGFWQIDTPTWQQFATKAGVDTSQYPNARSAPRDVQQMVASTIPLARFGPRTQTLLANQYGPLNKSLTLGELARQHGTAQPGITATTAPAPVGGVTTAPLPPLTGSQAALVQPAPTNVASAAPTQTPAGPQPTALPPAGPATPPAAGGGGLVTSAMAGGTATPPPTTLPTTPAVGGPTGPQMSLPMLIQALQNGEISYQGLLSRWQQFGLPNPQDPQAARVWYLLQRAGTPAGQGPGASAAADAAIGRLPGYSAAPLATTNISPATYGPGQAPPTPGPVVQPPIPPMRSVQPPVAPAQPTPPSLGPDESQAGRGPGVNAAADAAAGRLPGYPENAPLPPVRPADIGKPFAPPAEHTPATPPAQLQPKSARNAPVEAPAPPTPPSRPAAMGNLPRGVIGYTPQGQPVYSGDPEANLPRALKGTTVGNLLERAGLAGPAPPAWAGTAMNIQPADAARYLATAPGGPGAGAMPAALAGQPGAAAQPAAGPGLGGRLAGLGGGLLDLLSMTPAGGVPGLQRPSQYVMGGQNAPVPAPPGMPPPGLVPPGMPLLAGAPGGPAAAPATGGAAAPAPTGIEAQIAQHEGMANYYRQRAIGFSMIAPDTAKYFGQAAEAELNMANELRKQQTASEIKARETEQTTSAGVAGKQLEGLQTAYNNVKEQGGAIGLIRNVRQMRADLDAGTISGYGGAQGLLEHLQQYLALVNPASAGLAANSQEFNNLKTQETMQLLRTLLGNNKINRAEYQNFSTNNFSLAQRPDVLKNMLDLAEQRGKGQIQELNESIDRFQNVKANAAYKDAAEQFRIDLDKLPIATIPAAGRRPQEAGGGGGGAQLKQPQPDTLKAARAQIAAGKSREAVADFMRSQGFDSSGL